MEVYSEIHSVVSVVRIVCHTKFVSQIGPAVFFVKPEYMRVCLAYVCVERRHETKMDTNLGKKTHRAEKIATILGKKPHIYRVIYNFETNGRPRGDSRLHAMQARTNTHPRTRVFRTNFLVHKT